MGYIDHNDEQLENDVPPKRNLEKEIDELDERLTWICKQVGKILTILAGQDVNKMYPNG